MKVLYYGNCQLFAVKISLNLQDVKETHIECFNTNINESDFLNIIIEQDVIITQPINENYRDVLFLSTQFIINNCKKDCKIIIMDSCHFDFYYFDLTYKYWNNDILHVPDDYHYTSMMDCFKRNESVEYYLNNFVYNENLKTKEELENMANQSINELIRRYNENLTKYKTCENIFILSAYEYIRNNYKEKLLFYSMNHPTKFVIQNLCEQIIVIINKDNTIKYDVDILNHYKSILYKSVQKVVHFDLNLNAPLVKNNNNVRDITQLYFDTYTNIGF